MAWRNHFPDVLPGDGGNVMPPDIGPDVIDVPDAPPDMPPADLGDVAMDADPPDMTPDMNLCPE